MSDDDDDKQFVLEQQRKRFVVLKFIWKETRTLENLLNFAIFKDIAVNVGIYDVELFEILQYLQSEGLIELIQHMGQKFPVSRITHQGKIEIEEAIIKPTENTEHFLSSVIVNIATMNQTNINAGRDANGNVIDSQINAPITNNISNIQQSVETSEILQAIAELRQQISTLPLNIQEVADEALDTLKEEIDSPTSNQTKIKSAWMILCSVASKAKDINAFFSLQEHLSKLNIDLSDFHLPHL